MTVERLPILRPGWVLRLVPAILSVAVAFVLGSMHVPEFPETNFEWSDKVGHLFAFGFIQLTHARAFEFIQEPEKTNRQIWAAVISSTFVGGLLEVWQGFLPHRSAELLDLVADGVGAALAGVLYWALFRRDEPSSGELG